MDRRFPLIISGIVFFILAFLIGFLPNSTIFLAIKIFLIITAFVFFYFYQNRLFLESDTSLSAQSIEESPDIDHPDTPDEPLQIESDRDVERIFDSFLSTIMPLIKLSLGAETVVLLLINFSQKQFYIRHKISDHDDYFVNNRFIDLDQGLPSVVVKNKNPLVENHLPDTRTLVPYYSAKEPLAKAFLGVPVYYKQNVIGVLCADHSQEESFNSDDLKLMTMFSQLTKIQLISSNKLYEYETENWIAKTLYDFSKQILQFHSADQLWKYLSSLLRKVFGADRIIVSERMNEMRAQISFLNHSTASLKMGYEFPMNEGIVGWVFRKNQSLLVENFAEKENYVPRFQMNEAPEVQYRSYLAVPVSHDGNVRAVVSLESFKSNQFKEQTKKILETMAYQIAAFLEKTDIIEKLNAQNLFDGATGLGNLRALERELDREIGRCKEYSKYFSVALFKLNFYQKESGDGIQDKIVSEFLAFAAPLFPGGADFFRVSDNSIAVIFVEKLVHEALPIVRTLCDQVSAKKIWADGLAEDLVINCGLVQFPEMGVSVAELMEKARQALQRSEDKGPNIPLQYEDGDDLHREPHDQDNR